MRRKPVSTKLLNGLKQAYANGKDAVLQFAIEHKKELIAAGIVILASGAFLKVHGKVQDIKDIVLDVNDKKIMNKRDIEEKIKNAPFLYKVTGKQKEMQEELKNIKPEFILKARVKDIKFVHNPFRLGKLSVGGGYSPVTRNIILKPNIPSGGLSHEIFHAKDIPERLGNEKIINPIDDKAKEIINRDRLTKIEPPAYFVGNIARKRIGKKPKKMYGFVYNKLPFEKGSERMSLSEKKRVIREMYYPKEY
jgi:hypothetical protein